MSLRADLRYVGQEYTLTIALDADRRAWQDHLRKRFDDAYQVRFGHSNRDEDVEIVNLRATLVSPPADTRRSGDRVAGDPVIDRTESWAGGWADTPVIDRRLLERWAARRPGDRARRRLHDLHPTRLVGVGTRRRPPVAHEERLVTASDLTSPTLPMTAIDAITVEVIRNAFNSIAQQMNNNLARSAYTPIIYEMKDCSVALFDRKVQQVGQSTGLPVFVGTLETAVRSVVDHFGIDSLNQAMCTSSTTATSSAVTSTTCRCSRPRSSTARSSASARARPTGWTSGPRTRARPWTRPRSSRRATGLALRRFSMPANPTVA